MYEYLQSGKPIVATDICCSSAGHRHGEVEIWLNPMPAVYRKPCGAIFVYFKEGSRLCDKIAFAANDFTRTNPLKPVHMTLAETYQIIAATLPEQPIHQETSR